MPQNADALVLSWSSYSLGNHFNSFHTLCIALQVTLGPGSYSIEETAYWSERVYSHVMRLLNEYDVMLEGILLKPNMCLPGLDAEPASPAEVAKYTSRTMLRTIPASVPGIMHLSGNVASEFVIAFLLLLLLCVSMR
jgi:fructose-bisphosphate aldolase class 1